MEYRIETHDDGATLISFAPTRERALANARRISTRSDDLVFVVGGFDGRDTGSIIYSGGQICGREGLAI